MSFVKGMVASHVCLFSVSCQVFRSCLLFLCMYVSERFGVQFQVLYMFGCVGICVSFSRLFEYVFEYLSVPVCVH